jgi:hypothetical protein
MHPESAERAELPQHDPRGIRPHLVLVGVREGRERNDVFRREMVEKRAAGLRRGRPRPRRLSRWW